VDSQRVRLSLKKSFRSDGRGSTWAAALTTVQHAPDQSLRWFSPFLMAGGIETKKKTMPFGREILL
jgi:hypothetical protein